MSFTVVSAAQIEALNLGEVATQMERINGVQEGAIDTKKLLKCADRLNELTRIRANFLSPQYQSLRKMLREGFEKSGKTIRQDSQLYDETRRLMKNIRGAPRVKGDARTEVCNVCKKCVEWFTSSEGQQYFPD